MKSNQDFSKKVLNASKWSFISEISAKLVGPISLIVLARLLTPEDYGVITIATMVISFTQIFIDSGIHKAIVQTESKRYHLDSIANVAFWANLFFSTILSFIIVLISDQLALFLNEPRSSEVIKVLSSQIIFNALSSVQNALFQRELKFKKLFWVRLFTTIIPSLVSVPLAMVGLNYWALVWGQIFGSIANTITLWILTDWKPKLYFNFSILKNLLSFGIWTITEGITGWLVNWIDVIIIGTYLNSSQVGLYRTGLSLVNSFLGLMVSPIVPVLFSTLSRLQNNDKEFKRYFLQSHKIVFLLSFTVGLVFLLYGETLATIIYGDSWYGIGRIISILGFAYGFKTFYSLNAEGYRAKGKPFVNAIIMIVNLTIYIPTYVISAKHGLNAFVISKAVVMNFPQTLYHFYFSVKIFKVKLKEAVNNVRIILISGTITVLLIVIENLFLNKYISTNIGHFIFITFILIAYFLLLIPEWKFIMKSLLTIKNKITNKR